jgi:hypothetical protein
MPLWSKNAKILSELWMAPQDNKAVPSVLDIRELCPNSSFISLLSAENDKPY